MGKFPMTSMIGIGKQRGVDFWERGMISLEGKWVGLHRWHVHDRDW